MQYGMEITSYKRSRREQRSEGMFKYKWQIASLTYFGMAFFISRVILINNWTPFGLAFVISMVLSREDNTPVIAATGSLLGYLSIFDNVDNVPYYILGLGSVIFAAYYFRNLAKQKRLILFLILLLIEAIGYNLILALNSAGGNIFSSAFEVVCTLPVYYIIQCAMLCLRKVKSKYIFSNEEIISITMVMALVISGTWGVSFLGISLQNVITFILVAVCAYVNGSSTGASVGVAVGLIVGMTTDNLVMNISIFALCGFTVGLFRETSKLLSALGFIISFFILNLYTHTDLGFKLIEVLVSSVIITILPDKLYKGLALEFSWDRKSEAINNSHTEAVRQIFIEKLRSFSDILFSMSYTIKNLVNNDKLQLKNKSSALVENLADRVCANCSMKSICWKREIYYTYTAFGELIQNYHENKKIFPDELERKCINKSLLIKNTEDIIDTFINNEIWRNKLVEGRQLIANHLNNIGQTVKEMIEDFDANIAFKAQIEREVKRALERTGIQFLNVFCIQDKNRRLNVKIVLRNGCNKEFFHNKLLPLINSTTGLSMSIANFDKLKEKQDYTTVVFEETPKFNVLTYAESECKYGENFNGDSYGYGKLSDGTYMIVLSDGMGSGPEASGESEAAVKLIEKFAAAGFSREIAVNTVNSIMTMKFSEEEKFSTLDIANIDSYTGELTMMKVGAVSTFIKRAGKVEIINSKTLPMGVLDKVDIDVIEKKVMDGDILIMFSDGVLECEGNTDLMENWIVGYLEDNEENDISTIAKNIIHRAKEVNNGKAKDDMTVIVSKISTC